MQKSFRSVSERFSAVEVWTGFSTGLQRLRILLLVERSLKEVNIDDGPVLLHTHVLF